MVFMISGGKSHYSSPNNGAQSSFGKTCNYRPIDCLKPLQKLLIDIVADKVYTSSMKSTCYLKNRRGVNRKAEKPLINPYLTRQSLGNSKRKKTNLNEAWIDFCKACDKVPPDQILHSPSPPPPHPAHFVLIMGGWGLFNLSLNSWQRDASPLFYEDPYYIAYPSFSNFLQPTLSHPFPCHLQPSPSLFFLLTTFFGLMGDHAAFDVLLYLMIIWIYT